MSDASVPADIPSHSARGPLLAFDCAGGSCAAAVLDGGTLLARRLEERRRGQAERLVPLLQEVLAEAGLEWRALARLAVTRGPGSFTGVRIGLATARALALASRRPLLALDNFAVLAGQALAVPAQRRAGRSLVILIDSRRADIFLQCFDGAGAALGAAAALPPEALAAFLPAGPLLLAGDAVEQALPALAGRDLEIAGDAVHADPVVLARLAAALPAPGVAMPPPAPLYLRPPDVSQPKAIPPQAVAGSRGRAAGAKDG